MCQTEEQRTASGAGAAAASMAAFSVSAFEIQYTASPCSHGFQTAKHMPEQCVPSGAGAAAASTAALSTSAVASRAAKDSRSANADDAGSCAAEDALNISL